MDERFTIPDFDLDDDDYIAGECSVCFQYSRFINIDGVCRKCAKKDSTPPYFEWTCQKCGAVLPSTQTHCPCTRDNEPIF